MKIADSEANLMVRSKGVEESKESRAIEALNRLDTTHLSIL
jgi:hypothetical protein